MKTDYKVYDLTFGRIFYSYQGVKNKVIDAGYRLLTTSAQWFDMLRNREVGEFPSEFDIEVECIEYGHQSSVKPFQIQGCVHCRDINFGQSPLSYQNVVELANSRGLQVVSFRDDSQPLTEVEFNELVEIFHSQHQDPDDYKSGRAIYMNLKWRHQDHVFESLYSNVKAAKVDLYCPQCVSSIDQRQTLTVFQEKFSRYATSSIQSDIPLSRIVPNPRILLQNEYESIRHPRVHVDMFGVFRINGQEIKIAIEHQGPQHYSFESFLSLSRPQNINAGIFKTDAQYRADFDRLQERDRAKVELFRELNRDGYYLIVVKYNLRPSQRADHILQEFIRQTGLRLDQSDILDWV